MGQRQASAAAEPAAPQQRITQARPKLRVGLWSTES